PPISPFFTLSLHDALPISLFVNFFPDNPLWMIPFGCIEAYDVFFTKERYAMRSLQQVGLRNLHYLPMYCVPAQHHPVVLSPEETDRKSTRLNSSHQIISYA